MADPSPRSPNVAAFRFVRAAATGFSILFVIIAFWATWILYTKPIPVDFLSYWSASRLVLSGQVASVYDIHAHRAIERLIAPISGWNPFPYPPPFLFFVTPFGLAPFSLAFLLWVTTTGAIYVATVGRDGGVPYAIAQPPALTNILIGQNGFLTTAIFAGALRLLPSRPFFGGAMFGMMIIKPQLALVLPFAMIAGREWKAIAGGIASASAALLLAFIAFGWQAYAGFFSILPFYANGLQRNGWPWNELASVYAALSFLGFSQAVALTVHAIGAAIALVIVCRTWARGLEQRGPVLAAATLLVPPYVFTYDALLLAIPMLWLIRRQQCIWVVPIVWALSLFPITGYFGLYLGPNPIPIAAALSMWALFREARDVEEASPNMLPTS